MKKVLSILLVVVMLMSLFVACGKEEKPANDADNQNSTAEEQSADDETEADDNQGAAEAPELTKVKILAQNDMSADVHVEDWEKYPVSDVLKEDLAGYGVELEIETIDNESFANVVSTRLAAGTDVPDLVAWLWQSDAQASDWANSGLLANVTELCEKYDEDGSIKAFWDEKAPGVWKANCMGDGNLYWFSYLASGGQKAYFSDGSEFMNAMPHGISVRADWVEEAGLELQDVYSPEAFFDLLVALQENDANGNGQKDEIIYINLDQFYNAIAPAYGLHSELVLAGFYDDNVVFSNFYHENFPAYIEFLNKIYEAGLYDTVCLSTDRNTMAATNRVSAFATGTYWAWDWETINPDIDGSKDTYYMPIILDQDGDAKNGYYQYIDAIDNISYGQYFVPEAAENKEAVTRLMDYVYSDRYTELNEFGVKGLSYELNEDGFVEPMAQPLTDTTNFLLTGAGMYALPRMLVDIEMYSVTDVVLEAKEGDYGMSAKEAWVHKWRSEYMPHATFQAGENFAVANAEQQEWSSTYEETLTTYAKELLVGLALGNMSMDDYDTYLAELESLGLKEYIEMMQERRNRFLGVE